MRIAPLEFITAEPPALRRDDPATSVWQDGEGQVVALGATVGAWHWLRIVGAGSYRFPLAADDAGVAAQVVPQPGAAPRTVVDSYYRTVVPLALQAYGHEVLHGSAVAVAGRAVALCAPRESGKSTLAFALKGRGALALADDAVVVSLAGRDGSVPLVHAVPFALRLRESSAAHFQSPSKAEVAVGVNDSPAAPAPLPLAAVVLLERRAGPIELRRLAAPEAFAALLPHSYAFSLADAPRKRAMMTNYLRLARGVPAYGLAYPTGLEHLEEICARIAELAGAGSDEAVAAPAEPT